MLLDWSWHENYGYAVAEGFRNSKMKHAPLASQVLRRLPLRSSKKCWPIRRIPPWPSTTAPSESDSRNTSWSALPTIPPWFPMIMHGQGRARFRLACKETLDGTS